MIDGLITTQEASERTGKSVATINRAAKSGALPVAFEVKLGKGARFYRPEDVDAWVASKSERRAS